MDQTEQEAIVGHEMGNMSIRSSLSMRLKKSEPEDHRLMRKVGLMSQPLLLLTYLKAVMGPAREMGETSPIASAMVSSLSGQTKVSMSLYYASSNPGS